MTNYRCDNCGADAFRLRTGNPLMAELEVINDGMHPALAAIGSALAVGVAAACCECGYEADIADLAREPLDVVGRAFTASISLGRLATALDELDERLDAWDEDDQDDPIGDFLDQVTQVLGRVSV